MLTEQGLRGIYVPVVTPFHSNGELDLASFERLASHLLSSGIHGIVVNGTTGESPVITPDELKSLIQTAVKVRADRHIPIVVGTGTNDTSSTVMRTELAGQLGADAALVVVPYYSRPSQEGIIAHFQQVATTAVPLIVYEIPARTGVRLTVDTARTLLNMNNVIGMKDSSGGIELFMELSRFTSKPILCGEDAYFYAMLCCGAQGSMMASANVNTRAFVEVFTQFEQGRIIESGQSFTQLLPLIRLLFQEPNPSPLKWLLAEQGLIASDTVRLPMLPITVELQEQLTAYQLAART
ncbi:MAG: 4-hydroxy-tetrahydrodipicolinate synthase [Candidatus Pristimantibacillus sp.]